jgi:hypothetical protein
VAIRVLKKSSPLSRRNNIQGAHAPRVVAIELSRSRTSSELHHELREWARIRGKPRGPYNIRVFWRDSRANCSFVIQHSDFVIEWTSVQSAVFPIFPRNSPPNLAQYISERPQKAKTTKENPNYEEVFNSQDSISSFFNAFSHARSSAIYLRRACVPC